MRLAFGQHVALAALPEPPDRKRLEHDIDALIAETETPAFQRKLRAEIQAAKAFIENCRDAGERGFVVIDVDETTLDNRDFYRDSRRQFYRRPGNDFYTAWDAWVAQGRSEAIAPMKEFIGWLNNEKIPHIFLTGRIEDQKPVTERNLKQVGVFGESCWGLFCKSNDWQSMTTANHKLAKVAELEHKLGMKALASIGDLPADMMLPDSRRNFKLSSSLFYPPRR